LGVITTSPSTISIFSTSCICCRLRLDFAIYCCLPVWYLLSYNHMPNFINLEGKRIGRWLVTSQHKLVSSPKSKIRYWLCVCDCGVTKWVNYSNLMKCSRSCGCLEKELSKERFTTHGFSKTPFYCRYHSMLRRCHDPLFHAYHRYGGRGIKVEWKNFESFYVDMYDSFLRHSKKHGLANTTLDRANPDKNYSKENCKWATRAEQSKNKSKCV
jgi:hypothetical protein